MMNLAIKTATRRPNFIGELIGELDHYVKEHFTDEEAVMRKMNYSKLAAHHQEHAEFIKKVQKVHQEYKDGIFDLKALLSFIVHWFMEHVQGTDREFGEWAKTQAPKA